MHSRGILRPSPHLFVCVALLLDIVLWTLAASLYFDVVELGLIERQRNQVEFTAYWPEASP